jgi:hypothetical protein
MATIKKMVSEKTNKISYRVQIRKSGYRPKSKSFKTKKLAEEWARNTENNIERLDAFGTTDMRSFTLGRLIDECPPPNGRSARQQLKWWNKHFGNIPLNKFTSLKVREGLKLGCRNIVSNPL